MVNVVVVVVVSKALCHLNANLITVNGFCKKKNNIVCNLNKIVHGWWCPHLNLAVVDAAFFHLF